jgi:hypothetical protein
MLCLEIPLCSISVGCTCQKQERTFVCQLAVDYFEQIIDFLLAKGLS